MYHRADASPDLKQWRRGSQGREGEIAPNLACQKMVFPKYKI